MSLAGARRSGGRWRWRLARNPSGDRPIGRFRWWWWWLGFWGAWVSGRGEIGRLAGPERELRIDCTCAKSQPRASRAGAVVGATPRTTSRPVGYHHVATQILPGAKKRTGRAGENSPRRPPCPPTPATAPPPRRSGSECLRRRSIVSFAPDKF